MANKFLRKVPNRLLIPRNNYFLPGGPLDIGEPTLNTQVTIPSNATIDKRVNIKPWGEKASGNTNGLNNISGYAGAATALGTSIYNLVNKVQSSDIESRLKANISKNNASMPGPVNGDSYDQLTLDMRNYTPLKMTTAKDYGEVSGGQMAGNFLSSAASGAAAGSAFGGVGAAVGAAITGIMSLIGDAKRSGKARSASERDNAYRRELNNFADRSFINRGQNLNELGALDALTNIIAYGGPLNSSHGGYFSNGVNYIGNGKSHEQNPNGGVLMGIDPEGTPNLVEEGETIFNDFVYSNRIKVPKELRKKYKLGGDLTFSEAAQKLGRESEERPNDPISFNGLNAFMQELAYTQEEIKARQEAADSRKDERQMALGGKLFAKGGPTDDEDDVSSYVPAGMLGISNLIDDPQAFFDFMNNSMFSDTELTQALKNSGFLQAFKNGRWDKKQFQKWMKDETLSEFDTALRNYGYQLEGLNPVWKQYMDKVTDKDRQIITDNIRKSILDGYRNDPTKEQLKDFIDDYGLDAIKDGGVVPEDFLQRALFETTQTLGNNMLYPLAYYDIFGGVGEDLDRALYPQSYAEDQFPLTEEERKDPNPGTVLNELVSEREGPTPVQKIIEPAQIPETIPSGYDDNWIGILTSDLPGALQGKGYDEWGKYTMIPKDDFASSGESLTGWDALNETTNHAVLYGKKPKPNPLKSPVHPLEYLSAVGPGLGLIAALAGKPADQDLYESSLDAARKAGKVSHIKYEGTGDYITPKPFQLDYAANQYMNMANAANRTFANNAGMNRANAQANIQANMYNAYNSIGDMLMKDYREGHDSLLKDIQHNSSINTNNAEGRFKAAQANQSTDANSGDAYVRAVANANAIKQQARLERDKTISGNATGLFQNAGNMGRQFTAYNMMQHLIDDLGIAPGYTYTYDPNGGFTIKMQAKGGKIKRRKKRGLTY